jgi:biopolymer transport protein ExbB
MKNQTIQLNHPLAIESGAANKESSMKPQTDSFIISHDRTRRLPRTFVAAATMLLVMSGTSTALGQAAAAASPDAPAGFLTILFSGGIVGAIMIFILLALSLTAAYLIFDHLITIRRKDLMPEGLSEQVRQCLMTGNVKAAQEACNARPSFLSFVLMHGISELDFGWNAVEKSLEDALAEQSARLFRKIEYLSVIGNIAPMVGLLGTVIGMIIAFQNVASTQGTASAPQLAEGIYQALVTTVGGLIVAIPSIGAFAIFRNRIDQFVAEAAYIAQHVFAPLRRKAKR